MKKYSFKNDYSEGAHPAILEKLMQVNLEQSIGYGEDSYSNKAKELIKKQLKNPKAAIHFISGGTQANLIVIASILKPFESVIAAETGHIAMHETGAIEATGHKINTVKTADGKLRPINIQAVLDQHIDEHMVKPRLVYISNTTELGTLYSKAELSALSAICKTNNLLLFMDGARLAMALTGANNDLNLTTISKLTDVFYIGGTKNGALLGEAIVINNEKLQKNFRFHLKQRGALLAKGRLIGIQFLVLFTDNLFFELGKKANATSQQLMLTINDLGFQYKYEPVSNQLFPILPKVLINKLLEKYDFHIWENYDEQHAIIRLVCSWTTPTNALEAFIKDIVRFSN
jgi:threonine aldolase